MVNEINGLSTTSNRTSTKTDAVDAADTDNQQAPSSAQQSDSDRIELSTEAQLLGQLEKQVSALPDFDQARVDELREAINNGSFQVDNDSLAQSIIDFEF